MAASLVLSNIKTWLERQFFASKRLDYYQYLSSLLKGYDGRQTLKDIFLLDAQRYGTKNLRGRLSLIWLKKYQSSGGDLYTTWHGHYPHNELVLIKAAQDLGGNAVTETIDNLAKVISLLNDCKRLLYSVLMPAIIAALLLVMVCTAIPWFTVPKLMHTFSEVPPSYYGVLTNRLFSFAQFIESYFLLIWACLIAIIIFITWSFNNLTGILRKKIDNYFVWNIYRNIQALQFFMFLGVSLGREHQNETKLKQALLLQRPGATNWLRSHIDLMLNNIDLGHTSANTFNTGLLQKTQYWFFYDMFLARGLHTALDLICNQIHQHIIVKLTRQATFYRWLTLLFCVACILAIALWHYAVIDELRRSLTFVFS